MDELFLILYFNALHDFEIKIDTAIKFYVKVSQGLVIMNLYVNYYAGNTRIQKPSFHTQVTIDMMYEKAFYKLR